MAFAAAVAATALEYLYRPWLALMPEIWFGLAWVGWNRRFRPLTTPRRPSGYGRPREIRWCPATRPRPSTEDGDEVQLRRARFEHRMMSTLADIVLLQVGTVDTVRERLGADQPGMPWVVLECARGGHDLGPVFQAGAQVPASPLRDAMEQLAAAAARAKAAVWPNPAQ